MQGTLLRKTQTCIKWNALQLADLELWKGFLDLANGSISLNRLTFRPPSHIKCLDACEHGIGAFLATTGIAWRWKNPRDLQNQATLNVLEYLTGYLSIWMEIYVGNAKTRLCFLSQTDSTSAAGWIRKSNFGDVCPMHLQVAQASATLIMDHDSSHSLQPVVRRQLQ
jgi:hypothetical protein